LLIPTLLSAQTVSGGVALSVAKGTYTSDEQPSANSSFWQEYRLGYSASLFDPRLIKYNAEVVFRANSLRVGEVTFPQQGHQRDVGYKFGASLFPSRPFSLSVQASRNTVDETGDYPASGGIRGGIAVPPGDALPNFETRNSDLAVGGSLGVQGLPRVELGYRKGQSVVSGGPYHGEQRDEDLHVSVTKDTAHTKHLLRYQKTAYENLFSGAFDQRLSDLDYEFATTLSKKGRASMRVGRRTSFSLFDRPTTGIDVAGSAYQPVSRGQLSTAYVVSTAAYEPTPRVAVEVIANLDKVDAAQASTDARLASVTLRYDVFRGFSVNAIGTVGERGQAIVSDVIKVFTRSGQAGAAYHARVGWLDGSVRYISGVGTNTTPNGKVGTSRSWAGEANLSASSRWLTLSGGYDRAVSLDNVLAYGNLQLERWRSAVQGQAGHFLLNGSYEQSLIDRGVDLTYTRTRQQIFTGTVSLRLGRDALLSANAGGFRSDMLQSRDRTSFAGVSFESQLARALRLKVWARYGLTSASQTRLDQRSLTGLSQLEYLRRLFSFTFEYRYTDQNLWPGNLFEPISFRGYQVVLRVTRKFGVRF
jgi:hypothetical protein